MKSLNLTRATKASALLCTILLAACSSDGTVTTLDARPEVTFGVPDVLFQSDVVDQTTLQPTISLSNGDNVTLVRQGTSRFWRGTINVPTAQTYVADIVWVQDFLGQSLPLARKQQIVEVAADGSVRRDSELGFNVDIDTDQDGVSNFQELGQGTNPFVNNNTGLDVPQTPSQPATSPDSVTNPVPAAEPEPFVPPANEDVVVQETDTDTDTGNGGDTETDTDTGNGSDTETDTDAGNGSDTETDNETDNDIDPDSNSDADPTLATVDVIVPRIAPEQAPVIDGQSVALSPQGEFIGEWAAAVQIDNSGAPLRIDNLMIDINSDAPDGTPHRRWAAMHDGTYLYLVVLVDDDGDRFRDSPSVFDDDSLELFLDGDNSKSSSYGDDDFHRMFPVQLTGADRQSATLGDAPGPFSTTAPLTLDFATGPGIGPAGIRRPRFEQDVYELRVLISAAGINLDAPFGFELQVNDDDNGDGRDSKWGWKHPSRVDTDVDGTFTNPSLMGTLKLE